VTAGSFRSVLVGGSRRELHNDVVVETVLADRSRVGELFACVLADDEHVRMWAGLAVCRMLEAAGTAMPSSTETAPRPASRAQRSGTSASIALTPSDEPSR
jgi:hypothetical protein